MSAAGLRLEVRGLAGIAQRHVQQWFASNAPSPDMVIEQLPGIVEIYTSSAALMAANYYEDQDAASKFRATPAVVTPPTRYEDLAKYIFEGPQSPGSRLRASTHSMVFDAARDTVAFNANSEGVAYAREEEEGACGECMQKATLTAKDRNSRSDDVTWDRHTRCEFLFVPIRRDLYSPPEYAKGWKSRIEQARLAGNVNPEDIASWLLSH